MIRANINQRKRIKRRAYDFVNKRMRLDPAALGLSSSTIPTQSVFTSINERNFSTNEGSSMLSSDDDIDIRPELASWAVNSSTPAMHVDSLLKIIQKKIPELPKCCKTLLQTPKNAYENTIPMCGGYYLHVGLEKMLKWFLTRHKIVSNKIIIDVGIDGTPSTNSSDTELWPIMINVVDSDEILLIGCYFGQGKPKDDNGSPDEFLKPFVEEVLDILRAGGIDYENELYELHFRAFVMDAPARAFILNTILCTGYHSCTKCIVEGHRVAKRIIFHGVDHQLRTDFSFRNRIDKNHHHSNDITMIETLQIDMVKNIPIDSMHNVFIGVAKQLFKLWIRVRKMPYSITVQNIELLSNRIFAIAKQLPSEFSRNPRILKHLKRYKATEFRQFTLYTLIILLEDILPANYYNHFLKLHCAIRILCTPDDCLKNNDLAKELLKDFVQEFGILYGYKNLSHNVHSLLHLSEDVKHFKRPLDSYSAFKFENFLQYLKKLCRNNYRVLEQINNRFFEKLSVSNYEGDFKKQITKDRMNKSGNFTDIYKYNMHLSTKYPNNYVLAGVGRVFKIENIFKNCDDSFDLQVSSVQFLRPFYEKPIPSNLLNIFVSDENITSRKQSRIRVTPNLHKIANVVCNNKFFYLSLIH